MPKPMCSAIHHGLCITAYGTVNPCCTSDPFTKIDQIESITDHWFAKDTDLQAARDNEWEGGVLPACTHCYLKDEKGIMSRKAKMIKWWPFIDEEYTKKNTYDIVHMDISFGNTCNQKCIMCNSRFSSQWLEDDRILVEDAPFVRNKFNTVEKNWSLSYEQIDQIVALITKETRYIEFKGGEPMYDKRFYYLVKKAMEVSPDIIFNVCTNASFFNKKSVDFINSIPNINIDVSIDGIGKMYNWIRGFDFNKVDESFRYFLKHCKARPMLNYTTMRYNLDRFEQMYNWAADLTEEYSRSINMHFTQIVQNPKYMNPEYADKDTIKKAIDQLHRINEDPRKINPLPIFYERNNMMIKFLETQCLTKEITEDDKLLIAQTDSHMEKIRGYKFDPNM